MQAIYERCWAHIPIALLNMYKNKLLSCNRLGDRSDEELCQIIAQLILHNPICSGCLNPNMTDDCDICPNCSLDGYCSQECVNKHRRVHSK